jgi:methionyl aminopeptidase
MIHYKNAEEIELMRESALLVSKTLSEVAKILKPGITTLSLDVFIGDFLKDNNAVPSFLNFHGYPFNSCISVNDVVVHGFPGKYELREGDIVSIDVGAYKNGFHGDHAYTFIVGNAKEEVVQLVKVTKESLYKGIEKAIDGKRIGDFSFSIHENT